MRRVWVSPFGARRARVEMHHIPFGLTSPPPYPIYIRPLAHAYSQNMLPTRVARKV